MILLHIVTPVGEFIGEGIPGAGNEVVIRLGKPAAIRTLTRKNAIDPNRLDTVREMRLLSRDPDYWGENLLIGAGMAVVNQVRMEGPLAKQYLDLRKVVFVQDKTSGGSERAN